MEQDADSKVIALIQELQKQVGYLEKKIDMLVAQGAGRSSTGRSYAPPSRSYGAQQRYGNPRGNSFESKHTSSGHSYGKSRGDEQHTRYVEKKRPFRPGDKDRAAKNSKKFYPGSFNKGK